MNETAHLDEHQTRLAKLHQLKDAGIVTYAHKYDRTHTIAQLREKSSSYHLPEAEMLMESGAANTSSIAGRMMMFRTHGKLSFAQLRDASGDIQIAFVRGKFRVFTGSTLVESVQIADAELSADKFVEKYLDVGDFIGVRGELFMTKHGELTLFVNEVQLLSKALRPLGDKWHGIEDIEKKLRKRYLDTTMDPDTKAMLVRRSHFWQAMRTFLLHA